MSLEIKYCFSSDITTDGIQIESLEDKSKEGLYFGLFLRANSDYHYTVLLHYAKTIALFAYENSTDFIHFTLFSKKFVWQQIGKLVFTLYQYNEIGLITKILGKILHRWKCIQPYHKLIDPIKYIEKKRNMTRDKTTDLKKMNNFFEIYDLHFPTEIINIILVYYSFAHKKMKPVQLHSIIFQGLKSDSPHFSGFLIHLSFSSLYLNSLKLKLTKHNVGKKVLEVVKKNFGQFMFTEIGYYMFSALNRSYSIENLKDEDFVLFSDNIIEYLKKNDNVDIICKNPLLPSQYKLLISLIKSKAKDNNMLSCLPSNLLF